MQVFEFFLLFGYLDTKVDRNSVHWKLYSFLRDIVLFCFHHCVYTDEIDHLHRKIIDFPLLFFRNIVFPTQSLKEKKFTFTMKVHYLIHYVDAMYKGGPLLNTCTLKQERCLSGFNKYLLGSNNRKNQLFSIATWYLFDFLRTALRQNVKKENIVANQKRITNIYGETAWSRWCYC